MFEIIEIKHNENYIKIVFDTGESFKVAPDVFKMYSLKKGSSVDRIEYQQIKEESERFECGRKALDYLASRSRSSLEIENYLYRKGFSKNIINEITAGLKDSGYINDYNFALNFIQSRKRQKAVGENLLRSELFKKGVSPGIIKKAIAENRSDADTEGLYRLAVRKAELLKNRNNIESKLIFFLKQRGFHNRDIQKVINDIKNDGHLNLQDQD